MWTSRNSYGPGSSIHEFGNFYDIPQKENLQTIYCVNLVVKAHERRLHIFLRPRTLFAGTAVQDVHESLGSGVTV